MRAVREVMHTSPAGVGGESAGGLRGMLGGNEKCRGCPLFRPGVKGPVWGKGPKEARLALVGEAPGEEECRYGRPFVGKAGSVLKLGAASAGLSLGLCYITNVVKCMPPGPGGRGFRKPTTEEVEACATRWLYPELKEMKPNVVVALGDTALKALVRDGVKRGVTKWRGVVMEAKGW